MSYGYQEYGGNPYDATPGSETGHGQPIQTQASSNYSQATTPAQGYNASNPYNTANIPSQQHSSGNTATSDVQPASQTYGDPHTDSTAYASGGVVHMKAPRETLSNQEFLGRVESIRGQIRELTNNVGEIGATHQRLLASPDTSHAQLDSLVSNTQILNTKIKDQIRSLEVDAVASGNSTTKTTQIQTLKRHFRSQLEDYQKEEQSYRRRYQDQIAREYKIVNPDATEGEVREAAEADWGNEGVFQTALKSNRTGAASSVLGNVRARHNDIQSIEKTLIELSQMFEDLAKQVELQDEQFIKTEEQTGTVVGDTEGGNAQLDKAVKSARNRRKLKWWCLGISVLIICIIVAVIGGYFGYQANHNKRRRSLPELESRSRPIQLRPRVSVA